MPPTTTEAAHERPRENWLDVRESGGLLGMKFLLYLSTGLGRTTVRAFLRLVVLYYAIFHGTARRASRDYLRRMGLPNGFRARYRHHLRFAHCAIDRLFFIRGQNDLFEVSTSGHHHLQALAAEKRGAILLGAHLGSFEAMNAKAVWQGMTINVVGHFRNARMINQLLERQGTGAHTRLVEVRTDDIGFVLEMQECIERGELLALLGDRSVGGKNTKVDFLGQPATFPVGPYSLAHALRCPIYLTFGLYREPNRYELYCEPFVDLVELPRGNREQALREHAQRFARRLEHYCRLAPDNWFNFYSFWD